MLVLVQLVRVALTTYSSTALDRVLVSTVVSIRIFACSAPTSLNQPLTPTTTHGREARYGYGYALDAPAAASCRLSASSRAATVRNRALPLTHLTLKPTSDELTYPLAHAYTVSHATTHHAHLFHPATLTDPPIRPAYDRTPDDGRPSYPTPHAATPVHPNNA